MLCAPQPFLWFLGQRCRGYANVFPLALKKNYILHVFIILFLLAKNLKSNWKTDLNFGKKFSKRWYTQRCVNGLGKAESPKATTEKINIKQSNSEILLVYKDENDPIIEFYYSFVWSCWHNSERREKLYKTSWQLGDGRFCFPSSVFGCTLLPFGYKSSTAARTETRGGGELGEQRSNAHST